MKKSCQTYVIGSKLLTITEKDGRLIAEWKNINGKNDEGKQ